MPWPDGISNTMLGRQSHARACHTTTPVRALLEKSAVIAGVRQAVVRVPNESGELVTLDERLKEMRNDPRNSART